MQKAVHVNHASKQEGEVSSKLPVDDTWQMLTPGTKVRKNERQDWQGSYGFEDHREENPAQLLDCAETHHGHSASGIGEMYN